MKKNDLFKILGIIILVYAISTWIINPSYFQGALQTPEKEAIGLGYLLNVPTQSVGYFAYLFVFILAIGAFYELLKETGAYRKALDSIVKKVKNHKQIALIVITVLIALLSSFAGLEVGMIFIFPFIIALVILLGYDKFTALLATVGATIVGLLGSNLSYTAYGVVNQILSVDLKSSILVKIILLVLGTVLLVLFMLFNNRNKKGNKTKEKEDLNLVPEKMDKEAKNKKVWPLITIVAILFVILNVGAIGWSQVFNVTFFSDALEWFAEINIFGYPFFANLFNGISPFGTWAGPSKFVFFVAIMIIASIIIAIVYKISLNKYLETIKAGAKKNLGAAFIAILAYVVLVLASSFQVYLTMTKAVTGEKFNIATLGLMNLLGSSLYPDLYYYPQYVLAYFQTFKDVDLNVLSVLFVSTFGVAMLVAPTSVILSTTLINTETKYLDWLKYIWKLFVALLALVLITLLVYFLI